ncbi:MAG: hypothetical protein ACP5RH_05240 [Leptodesmis sp.]|uniref:hypothetical protein n=1 Tax=Leptodesmis sp. TaxID=3100501 RepID=UPI003D13459A
MFKQSKKNLGASPTPKTESLVPDPWEVKEPEPRFPSPLELDRLLREPHPLISAAEELPEISPAGQPGVELLPAPKGGREVDLVAVLLNNELKLRNYVFKAISAQVEKALALLYWLASGSDHRTA